MNKQQTYPKHDVLFSYEGDVVTIEHNSNLFNRIIFNHRNPFMMLAQVYESDKTEISVMLDTKHAYYFLVKDNKVLHRALFDFETAKQIADEFNYGKWLQMQGAKGLPKKQFIQDVMSGKMMARKTFTNLDGRNFDSKFYPLVKTKGQGSIDIDRDGKASVVFFLDSMKSKLMWYSGEKLVIYKSGFRLYTKEEIECVLGWEKIRNRKEEMLDVMTDGSEQFYRKREFFKDHGYEYLLNQRYNGLVQDDTIRESVNLEYSILKLQ